VVADVEARVWLTGADARRQVRVKRVEVGRRLGAAAWLGVRASGGVGACPRPGVARTRACALHWCGGAVSSLSPGGRKEKGRGRYTGPPVSEGKREGRPVGFAGLRCKASLGRLRLERLGRADGQGERAAMV
jgi:hypothetical protein